MSVLRKDRFLKSVEERQTESDRETDRQRQTQRERISTITKIQSLDLTLYMYIAWLHLSDKTSFETPCPLISCSNTTILTWLLKLGASELSSGYLWTGDDRNQFSVLCLVCVLPAHPHRRTTAVETGSPI